MNWIINCSLPSPNPISVSATILSHKIITTVVNTYCHHSSGLLLLWINDPWEFSLSGMESWDNPTCLRKRQLLFYLQPLPELSRKMQYLPMCAEIAQRTLIFILMKWMLKHIVLLNDWHLLKRKLSYLHIFFHLFILLISEFLVYCFQYTNYKKNRHRVLQNP